MLCRGGLDADVAAETANGYGVKITALDAILERHEKNEDIGAPLSGKPRVGTACANLCRAF